MPTVPGYVPLFGNSLHFKKRFLEKKFIPIDVLGYEFNTDAIAIHGIAGPVIYLKKAEYANDLFSTKQHLVTKPGSDSFELARLLGKGESILFMETNERWSDKRQRLMKAFNFQNLKGMINIMKKNIAEIIVKWEDQGALKNETNDFGEDVNMLGIDIIAESGFGSDGKAI
jgi:cytochrome P450